MKRYLLVVWGMLSLSQLCGAGELHEFRTLDGKCVKAEILAYNGRLDVVTLKLPNQSMKKVHPGLFVAKDREYIKNWSFIFGLKNPSKFAVKVNKKQGDYKRKDVRGSGTVKIQEVRYDIAVENLNSFPLENLSIEYKIFLKPRGDGRWPSGLSSLLGSVDELQNPPPVCGAKECLKIDPSETVQFETRYARSVKLKSSGRADSSGKKFKNQELDLEGIWVRVIMEIGDEMVFRDFFAPKALEGKYSWDD
jgi:hypothetical protein